MKPGTKLKSATCDTEVMVIRGANLVVECGGRPMLETRSAELQTPDPAHVNGSMIGKRYVNAENTLELLCTKPGKGSLSVAGTALQIKDAKPLPSSD